MLKQTTFLCLVTIIYDVISASPDTTFSRSKRRADSLDTYGPWSDPGECSRTCGGGVHYQTRQCVDLDEDGELFCEGPNRLYSSCNVQNCPDSADFRAEQCTKYNNVPFKNEYYEWIPYYDDENPCELNCQAVGETFYYRHAKKVVDGTPCSEFGDDVCVDGECQSVGCDKMLTSTLQMDRCQVCGGDDSSCKTLAGVLETDNLKKGYNDVLLIPAGATSIMIKEDEASNNYLALRNMEGEYYLNGDFMIDLPKPKDVAGTRIEYERGELTQDSADLLKARGPTKETLYLAVLKQDGSAPMITYEYSIPNDGPSDEDYEWNAEAWGECSMSCASGFQSRDVLCMNVKSGEEMDTSLCDPFTKPPSEQKCNTQPCPGSWRVYTWGECSASCGEGTRRREVVCEALEYADVYTVVKDSQCEDPMPSRTEKCEVDVDCPGWEVGDWSQCNTVCGEGQQTRQVICRARHSLGNTNSDILADSMCNQADRPLDTQMCSGDPCEGVEWITSEWSGCEGSCDDGVQTRTIVCSNKYGKIYPDTLCDSGLMPDTQRPCAKDHHTCDQKPKWHYSEWGPCSARCGAGTQTRHVLCAKQQGGHLEVVDNGQCDPTRKMESSQKCTGQDCTGQWFTAPWGKCSINCGGGHKQREVLCLEGDKVSTACNKAHKPAHKHECNTQPCEEGDCVLSDYGCCPDGVTSANGPDFLDCPPQDPIPRGYCVTSQFGCCLDNLTPAQGPFRAGCPAFTCLSTQYGCCDDNQTPAGGPNGEGCPKELGCVMTAYGCCPDKVTPALGFNLEGCGVIPGEDKYNNCHRSTYGCCVDGVTTAKGPGYQGCPDFESSGESCEESIFGCCADGTPATGPNEEGCNVVGACDNTHFGCCPDGVTRAQGPNYLGCAAEPPEATGCENSLWGCCPDNKTPANGPDSEDCPGVEEDCNDALFGCCDDGETIAKGPNSEGCPVLVGGCAGTRHGCCDDGLTSATGPNNEGCLVFVGGCAGTRHGCCEDGLTSATGPNNDGCPVFVGGCAGTRHGCCEDGLTSATGPNNEGCPVFVGGCAGTRHGCCDDGLTSATGPNNEGCPIIVGGCAGTRHGCCNDGMTGAAGPNFEGCPDVVDPNVGETLGCDSSEFGCCPDGSTPAQGSSFEGCEEEGTYVYTCVDSTFGCCPDKVTFAAGPDDAGCPSKIAQGAACGIANQRGSCSNYSVKWYFDPAHGACSRFWYGGCEGNGNRFDNQQECKNTCVEPQGIDVCYLPVSVGRCKAAKQRYHYNPESGECETFVYGGCDGNDNNFETIQQCESRCVLSQKPNVCSQPLKKGPCRGEFKRWYYNSQMKECREFTYGGCKGNENRFHSRNACEGRCTVTAKEICRLPKEKGPCNIEVEKYYFNWDTKACETFVYGGCQGNANKFSTVKDCQSTCDKFVETKDICTLPKETGPCVDNFQRWYYDSETGYCQQFTYGGCGGNKNKFETELECRQSCHAKEPVDICTLNRDPGPCSGSEDRYFFDANVGRCRRFNYRGCEGNENNFVTEEECEKRCGTTDVAPTTPVTNRCLLERDAGPCLANMPRFYFDSTRGRCAEFVYGGCGGNRNRFVTLEACLEHCGTRATTPSQPREVSTRATTQAPDTEDSNIDICTLPKQAGNCEAYIPSWYYDQAAGACQQFVYGGCSGNENRFETQEECEERCATPRPKKTGTDVCTLRSDSGPCAANIQSWYYNPESGVCTEFSYGGCEGNENRFNSIQACQNTCNIETICTLPSTEGPCRADKPRYYFDKVKGACSEFRYGGCDGNANNFLIEETCNTVCEPIKGPMEPNEGEDRCVHPKDAGPCQSWTVNWYYDQDQLRCLPYYYGGCLGNSNNFPDSDTCNAACKPKPTTRPTIATEKPVVDESENEVEKETEEKETTTAVAVGVAVCKQRKDPGPCDGYYPVWYFEPITRTCRRFLYRGCEGNGNRFETREECTNTCVRQITKAISTTTSVPSTTTLEMEVDGGSSEGTDSSNNVTNICSLRKEVGPCQAYQLRWYYDETVGRCLQFQFGGCQGNYNNFKTEKECGEMCRPDDVETTTPIKEEGVCELEKKPGPCFGSYLRYHYDAEVDECRPFTYGGCQGNGNNFEKQEECYSVCSEKQTKDVRIHKPGDCFDKAKEGPCRAAEIRWYYDYTRGECTNFYYGGCGGNGNNFRSYDDCHSVCSTVLETCGVIQCNMECPQGYARGEDGCPRCECSDPCQDYFCPEGTECVIEEADPTAPFCTPTGESSQSSEEPVITDKPTVTDKPTPRPEPKEGRCPAIPEELSDNCDTECVDDIDCDGEAKCCATNCGRVCLEPAQPAVDIESAHGTCPHIRGGLVGLCGTFCEEDKDCPTGCKCCTHDCGKVCLITIEDSVESTNAGSRDSLQSTDAHPVTITTVAPHTNNMAPVTVVAVTREGHCPLLTRDVVGHCDVLCISDNDCPANGKCCAHECGRVCIVSMNTQPTESPVVSRTNAPYDRRIAQRPHDRSDSNARTEADPVRTSENGSRDQTDRYINPEREGRRHTEEFTVTIRPNVNKEGECPELHITMVGFCGELCSMDADCPGSSKCCRNDCGKVCMVPAADLPDVTTLKPPTGKGCEATVFGCCLDGVTPAGGYDLIGCPEEKPSIKREEENIIGMIGETIMLRCEARGSPTPQIQWYLNRAPIRTDDERFALLRDGSLEISTLEEDDAGVYTCRAYNNVGSANIDVTVEVYMAPKIKSGPAAVVSDAGASASLTCEVDGNPKPTIEWFHNSLPVDISSADFSQLADGQLVIEEVSEDNVGDYVCEANNGIGNTVLRTVTLDVRGRFTIEIVQENDTYAAGTDVEFLCEIKGDSEGVMLSWIKDGLPLPEDRRYIVDENELTIMDTKGEDAGIYECVAMRGQQKQYATTTLSITRPLVPVDCIDKPWYANCQLIVGAKLCNHPYFSVFCCRSCHLAGLL